MARPLRIEFPGAVYHITSRGNAQAAIYLSDEDKNTFLAVLEKVIERFGWICHAYCLMDNHYHLLIETPAANLSRGMRHLNGVYTQRFNRSHRRVGHIFQGRFKAILVEKESHLLELCRYVVLNPVRAKMVGSAEEYSWSSYPATLGLAPAAPWLAPQWLLSQFADSIPLGRQRYQAFVNSGLTEPSPLSKLCGSDVLGSDAFSESIQNIVTTSTITSREVPRQMRAFHRATLDDLATPDTDRGKWMSEAYRQHSYTMREIATYAGLHYSSVSKIIASWENSKDSTFKTSIYHVRGHLRVAFFIYTQ